MNRQSRKVGISTWTDRGNVSFKDAAIQEAQDWTIGEDLWEKCLVEVRDQDNPGQIFNLVVQADIKFNVTGLRGGDN